VQEREKRGCRELLKKRRGTNVLYTWQRVGLADEAGSDAIPDAAGGEGGHGAAKPHGVIHRYRVNIDKSFRVHVVYSSDFRWIGKTILP
jgi:hypothetical protein